MTNLKVGTRLGWGFGAVLLMLALVVAVSIVRMAELNKGMNQIVVELYPKVLDAQQILNDTNQLGRALRNAMLRSNPQDINADLAEVGEKRAAIKAVMNKLDTTVKSKQGRTLFDTMAAAQKSYDSVLDKTLALLAEARRDEAIELLFKVVRPSQQQYIDRVMALIHHQSERMESGRRQAEATYESARVTMAALGLLALALGVAGAFVITRTLLRQLGGEPEYAVAIAEKIAAGDLTGAIVTRAHDQHSLLFAIKRMRDSLAGIVGDVRSGTETIATASGEIAAGNLDLSSRTEQQASALEETASSMEQLTATVKQNASHARQANQLAQSASDVAVKGGAVVSQVVDTMGAINDSSKKIADIIGVIDGIAFQTNILALNAAVEAARAGEQGRGFAVVATEVRNLAQRSAGAAREIKTLIDDSVAQVGAGARLVDQAGLTMEEIVASVRRVTDIMGEISGASVEQEAGIEQINRAITEMDGVTQQNAALVEQAAAAAGSLREQSVHLAGLVGVFKLDGVHPSGAAAAPMAPPRRTPAPPARRMSAPATAAAAAKAKKPALASTDSNDGWEEF